LGPLTTGKHAHDENVQGLYGGGFSMTDHDGKTISDKDFRGRPYAMFFGFTSCPDVCPTTLARLSALKQRLGDAADRIRFILVSVDPERDTPGVMKAYLSAFDPGFIGLTGTHQQLLEMSRNYRFYFKKRPLEKGEYSTDHTSGVFLYDDRGLLIGTIDQHEDESTALRKLARLLEG
jgi:protein SCO1/2